MSAETKEAAKEEGIRLLKVREAALVLMMANPNAYTDTHTHTRFASDGGGVPPHGCCRTDLGGCAAVRCAAGSL